MKEQEFGGECMLKVRDHFAFFAGNTMNPQYKSKIFPINPSTRLHSEALIDHSKTKRHNDAVMTELLHIPGKSQHKGKGSLWSVREGFLGNVLAMQRRHFKQENNFFDKPPGRCRNRSEVFSTSITKVTEGNVLDSGENS